MAERVGTEIAGFRIESLIARGGMGEVYLATQTFPERRVAMKLLPHDLASDPAFRERFIRESNAAASLEHPNIVPVYGAGEVDGDLYIAMRYVEGEDLRSLLDRGGPLPPQRAVSICVQVAEALEEAHEHGLIHRDVKPGNILVAKGDRAYLTDFGLIRRSKLETDLTRTGQLMGTVDYVAPEQIRGETVDGRADVYSLGCVLFECLAGESPFKRDTEVGTLYAHLEEKPPPLLTIDAANGRELDRLVAKALAKIPSDRYQTAGQLADAASRVIRSAEDAGAGDAPTRMWKWVAGAAVAILTLVIALSTFRGGHNGTLRDGAIPQTTTTPALKSVVTIDSEGNVVNAIPNAFVGSGFGTLPDLAAGEGSVWLVQSVNLTQIDPASAEIERVTPLAGSSSSLDLGFRTVWVGTPTEVMRVDPGTGRTLRSVDIQESLESGSVHVAAGMGAIWVTLNDAVGRIDPVRNTFTSEVAAGDPTDVDVGEGAVWVLDNLHSSVSPIDPATNELGEPIHVSGDLDQLAAGAGGVWVLDRGGIVSLIDPRREIVVDTIAVGEAVLTDMTTGLDAVWVGSEDGAIYRIDPTTRQVTAFDVGSPISAVAVDASSKTIWATISCSSSRGACAIG